MNEGAPAERWADHTAAPEGRRWLLDRCDLTILGCVLLGTLVRAYAFGAAPPGLHQDEASQAYDAYALLHYGIDHNGFHNPVAFVGLGSGMSALTPYVMMPFIAVLGLTSFAARLPFLLAGMTGLLLFVWLVRQIHGIQTARVAAFLLAICPWHILISRWAHESNLLPTVLLGAVLAMVLSLNRPVLLTLSLSLALFALALYAYGPAYIGVPLYLAMAIPYGLHHRCWGGKTIAAALVVGALVALPALVYLLVNALEWDSIVTPLVSVPRLPGVPRFESVVNFRFWEPDFFRVVALNYASAAKLLIFQSDGLMWNAVPGFGLIYLFSLPLALWGFGLLCRDCVRRGFTPAYFIFAWCLTSAALPIFVVPNINRLNVALLPLVYCTTLGVSLVQERWRVAFYGLVGVYVFSFAAFTGTYFGKYQSQVGQWFYPGLVEAIAAASSDPQAKICVTHGIYFPHIFALFATKEDPHEYLRTVKFSNADAEFQEVASYGRYLFGLQQADQSVIDIFVIFDAKADYPDEVFSTEKFGNFLVLRKRK